jgi:hypothetical protein
MKVQYTIAGWAPVPSPRAGAAQGSAFEARLRESAATMPTASREILGLNRPRPGEIQLSPPQRPATLAYCDLEEERRIWHTLLHQHAAPAPMLALLEEIQRAEDEISARALVDSRG